MRQQESTRELDLHFDNWRQNFRDKIHYDHNKPTPAGETHRNMMWTLGQSRFHATYTEVSAGRSTYKLITQPINEKEVWTEIFSLDDFRKALVEARRTRDYTANEKKAMAGMESNYSDHKPDGVVMTMLSGSHLYGLNHTGLKLIDGTDVKPSDEDIRGVFVMSTSDFVINRHKPKMEMKNDLIQIKDSDEKYEEIDRFIYECLKCNPERLELLNAPLDKYTTSSNEWLELLKIKSAFYCKKRMFDALGGYSQAQFMKWRKKEGDLWKPGMHLLRLMIMGTRFFETGDLNPDMRDHRDYLLSVRTGHVKAEAVEKHFEELKLKFQKLYDETKLIPEQPDNKKICDYLINLRKNNW